MKTRKNTIIVAVAFGLGLLAFGAFAYIRGALSLVSGFPKVNWALVQHPRPDVDKEVVFPESYPESAHQAYLDNLQKIKDNIAADSTNEAAWNDLAIYRKMVSDYQGAEAIWQYQIAIRPENNIALHNLAELYFHYLKDYRRAEKLYFKAIAMIPNVAINYTDLFEMYRYAYKQDSTAAVDILTRGIDAVDVHTQIDMLVMLASYYEEKGNKVDAKAKFLKAAELANQVGNPVRAAQMRALAEQL